MKPISNTNSFSLRRLLAIIKCDLVENRTRYIGVFLLMFIIFLGYQLSEMKYLVESCQYHATHPETPETSGFDPTQCMAILARKSNAIFYYTLIVTLVFAAAEMFAVSLKTKMRTIGFLMMPASSLEKFISRTIINTVVVIMVAYAALFSADLVRMLFVPLFEVKDFYEFTAPFLRETVYYINPYAGFGPFGFGVCRFNFDRYLASTGFTPLIGIMTIVLYALSAAAIHSFFVLGGCIWRKGALIKTLLIGFVTIYITVWGLVEVESLMTSWLEQVFSTKEDAIRIILSVGIPLCIIITTLNWWLSYRLFSRKQVVPVGHLRFLSKRKEVTV